jgi:hypothetical protein
MCVVIMAQRWLDRIVTCEGLGVRQDEALFVMNSVK